MDKDLIMQSAAGATGNGTAIDTALLSHLSMQVSGTFSATVTFEATVDGTNWVSLQVSNVTNGAVSTTATAAGIFTCSVAGLAKVRARVSTWVSGSVTVRGFVTQAVAGWPLSVLALAANTGVDIGDVDVTSISAGDNNIGNVDVLTINAVAPQFDDTDKMAVSLYGSDAAAGDVALVVTDGGAIKTIDNDHYYQHEGGAFTAHIDNTVTNIGEMTVFAFNTPASGDVHLWASGYSSHLADMYIYENTSIDVDEGVDLVPVNRRRTGTPATTVLSTIKTAPEVGKITYYLEAAAAAANITTTTVIDHAIIIAGAGPKSIGSVGGDSLGYILANSQQYAIVLTAATADTATHTVRINWIEH